MSCQQLHLPLPPPLVLGPVLLFGLSRPFVHDKYSEGKKLVLEGLARDFKRLFPPNAVQRKQKYSRKTLQDVWNKMLPHSVVLVRSPPFFMSSEHPTMTATRKEERAKGGEGWREAFFLLLIFFSSRRSRLSSSVPGQRREEWNLPACHQLITVVLLLTI